MSKDLIDTAKELDRLTSSELYKKKNFDSRQKSLMGLKVDYKGKKIKLKNLYGDTMGYSDRAVICGRCNKKGIIRKRGDYYEIHHGRSDKKTCYLGKYLSEEMTLLPLRIIGSK